MTKRKPDFYVVKRGSNAKRKKVEWLANGYHWVDSCALSFRYLDRNGAAIDAANRCGRVVPVFCTSKRAEPKMRERSSSWVLKRLAEGKVLVIKWASTELVHRFLGGTGAIQYFSVAANGWKNSQFVCHDGSGRVFCRIARPSEVPQ